MFWCLKGVGLDKICVLKKVAVKARSIEHHSTKDPQKCDSTHSVFNGEIRVEWDTVLGNAVLVFVFLYLDAIWVV